MNSLCIKTNNDDILQYLKNEFSEFNMSHVYFSINEFKLYNNIIIHYTGDDVELFYNKLATILSYFVIDYAESDIIKNILHSNYFYFDSIEFADILNLCYENLCDDNEFSFQNRHLLLFNIFYDYITNHHSLIISGFINFRLSSYRTLLEDLVDFSVNEFIIEREYLEFISLLKLYINSQPSLTRLVHVISSNYETLLLDENLNTIDVDKNSLNAKYLSDVSFSNNDFVLNTLLSLLPQKLFIHQISSFANLEFMNTLKLIFDGRIEICNDCNICNLYKNLNVHNKK